jgi:hypothetical protein
LFIVHGLCTNLHSRVVTPLRFGGKHVPPYQVVVYQVHREWQSSEWSKRWPTQECVDEACK